MHADMPAGHGVEYRYGQGNEGSAGDYGIADSGAARTNRDAAPFSLSRLVYNNGWSRCLQPNSGW